MNETIENKLLSYQKTKTSNYKYCSSSRRIKKLVGEKENSIYIISQAACRLSIKQQEEMKFLHRNTFNRIGKQ